MPPRRDRPPRCRRAVVAALAVLALVLLPAVAAARAGGGGGFHSSGGGGHSSAGSHSSGHSSGGHSSGGGGDGVDLWVLVDLVSFLVRHPAVGVPVAVVVVGVGYYLWANRNRLSTVATRAYRRPGPADAGAVDRLRAADPAFDAAAFGQRVTAGFHTLQDAWCRQDLSAVRPFLSDAVHERFAIQFAEQRAAGYHDRMGDVTVHSAAVADATSDAVYDTVAVRLMASARDQRVSTADGRVVAGSAAVEPFAEVWSFLRRRGAQTTPGKAGLLEGNCPNCGAAVAMNQSANCDHCGAALRSGDHDWVLAEITQDTEWSPGQQAAVPGLAALRAADPDLNVQAVEDRASVVFWRRAAADRVGKVDPLRKAATDDYLQTVRAQLRPGPDGGRTYTGECAVGSVQTVGFLPASGDQPFDRAVVDVTWTGTRFSVAGDGRPPRAGGESTVHTLLVLGRRAGVRTDVAKGISSAHCPQCGAPDDGGPGGACPFCGAVLNDGGHGWVLTDVQPADGPVTGEVRSAPV